MKKAHKVILIALSLFVLSLFGLALAIHFIMLGTDRFNWLEGPAKPPAQHAPP